MCVCVRACVLCSIFQKIKLKQACRAKYMAQERTHLHRYKQTNPPIFTDATFVSLDAVPNAPFQHITEFVWWCVCKCTCPNLGLRRNLSSLTSHCHRPVLPLPVIRTQPYCSGSQPAPPRAHLTPPSVLTAIQSGAQRCCRRMPRIYVSKPLLRQRSTWADRGVGCIKSERHERHV